MKRMAWLPIVALFCVMFDRLAVAEEPGSLVIIGGALRYAQTDVWNRIVELAGGPGARIAVFPTASSDPAKYGPRSVAALRNVGADAFLIPVSAGTSDADYRAAVNDAKLVEQVKSAGGVFFIGGSQERITRVLGSSAGDRTPLLEAVWDVYRRGGMVAGTSAGAAVMSQMMFREPPSVFNTLKDGLHVGKELAPGLGFLDARWFVDQHCLARGRFGRSLVAMQTLGLKFGVGVDDNTALVVRGGRAMSVIGYRGAIVLDLSQADTDPTLKRFNVKNAKLTYLDRGDAIDLQNLQLTPSAEKQADLKIDPSAATFRPTHDDTVFTTDILANSALLDLMGRLIDNKQPQAIGLAFDATDALRGPTDGFEFRFYRGPDSVGWYTTAGGAGAYTVANIHLDIRPVEVAGLLYK